MFITFEGIEGSGKSTMLRRLAERLRVDGRSVLTTREPGGSRLGIVMRQILLDVESADLSSQAELFLYLADRAQHARQIIRPALDQGRVVLCDRYADSTVAYQGYGRGLDPRQLHEFNDVAVAGLWPHYTFLLDLSARTGLNRALARNMREGKGQSEGRFEAESVEFHTRVREGYLTWAALHRERFVVIDASRTEDEVYTEVEARLMELLEAKPPLGDSPRSDIP